MRTSTVSRRDPHIWPRRRTISAYLVPRDGFRFVGKSRFFQSHCSSWKKALAMSRKSIICVVPSRITSDTGLLIVVHADAMSLARTRPKPEQSRNRSTLCASVYLPKVLLFSTSQSLLCYVHFKPYTSKHSMGTRSTSSAVLSGWLRVEIPKPKQTDFELRHRGSGSGDDSIAAKLREKYLLTNVHYKGLEGVSMQRYPSYTTYNRNPESVPMKHLPQQVNIKQETQQHMTRSHSFRRIHPESLFRVFSLSRPTARFCLAVCNIGALVGNASLLSTSPQPFLALPDLVESASKHVTETDRKGLNGEHMVEGDSRRA